MNSGLFVFMLIGFIFLCAGIIISVVLFKMAWIRKEREALASTDLRVLEESAIILIEQMKSELDDRIAEIDKKSAHLAELTHQADARISAFNKLSSAFTNKPSHESSEKCTDNLPIFSVNDGDSIPEAIDCAELARSMDLSAAEVKLMMRLADLGIDNN
jgi:hypothetical protein